MDMHAYHYRIYQSCVKPITCLHISARGNHQLVVSASLLAKKTDEIRGNFRLNRAALRSSPDIDYDVYAQGEAELAWYDGRFTITANEPLDMDEVLVELGSMLGEQLSGAELEVAHVKLLLRDGERVSALSLPHSNAAPELIREANGRGAALTLIVNARVAARPEELSALARRCLREWAERLGISLAEEVASSFSPPRPVPTRRID